MSRKKTAAEEDNEQGFEWWLRARDALSDGALAQALVCIKRYRIINPDAKFTQLMYGMISTELRRFDEACTALNQVLPLPKARSRRVAYKAWIDFYQLQGNYAEEEKWCRKLVEEDPESTVSYIFLGSCLARQGKLEEAEAVYRHATTLEGDPDAFLNLGLVLRAQGRFLEAGEAFKSALILDPDYSTAEEALDDVEAAIKIA
jgi:tetratricopeptide (TPR) repeat protein